MNNCRHIIAPTTLVFAHYSEVGDGSVWGKKAVMSIEVN